MADKSARRQVVIEDDFIARMVRDARARKRFPFLKQYHEADKARGCGGCGGRARDRAADYAEIKRTLAAMPPDKQAELLKYAGADSVKFWYRPRSDPNGVVKFVINSKP